MLLGLLWSLGFINALVLSKLWNNIAHLIGSLDITYLSHCFRILIPEPDFPLTTNFAIASVYKHGNVFKSSFVHQDTQKQCQFNWRASKEGSKRGISVVVGQKTCPRDTLKRLILGKVFKGGTDSGHGSCQWILWMSHRIMGFDDSFLLVCKVECSEKRQKRFLKTINSLETVDLFLE